MRSLWFLVTLAVLAIGAIEWPSRVAVAQSSGPYNVSPYAPRPLPPPVPSADVTIFPNTYVPRTARRAGTRTMRRTVDARRRAASRSRASTRTRRARTRSAQYRRARSDRSARVGRSHPHRMRRQVIQRPPPQYAVVKRKRSLAEVAAQNFGYGNRSNGRAVEAYFKYQMERSR